MKIILDQNLSFRVGSAVRAALPDRAGYEVQHIDDVQPPGTEDPDWLRMFSDNGGTAIVSGDFNILRNWPDLVAYTETGLISFFPPAAFERLSRFGKVAFLIRWWPAIVEKIKLSSAGDRWRLPLKWENPSHADLSFLKDPRVRGRTVEEKRDATILTLPQRKTGGDGG